jgi:hypothetical protein
LYYYNFIADFCWYLSNTIYTFLQAVVSCLVDIYIMFGKTFVPYLEGLNSTQLRLVTIYANRVSQARSGATVDANQWIMLCMALPYDIRLYSWVSDFIHLYIEQTRCLHVFTFSCWLFLCDMRYLCICADSFLLPCTHAHRVKNNNLVSWSVFLIVVIYFFIFIWLFILFKIII